MNPIRPNKIRYIKLGEGGKWEKGCIAEGTVRLGYESPHHDACLQGDWYTVRKFWLNVRNGNQGAATSDANQIRDFYELSSDDVWITFHNKHLYWCCAALDVHELPDGSRCRTAIGGWKRTDLKGQELRIDRIDGRITQVRRFQGTVCQVAIPDYLVRRINGDMQPDVALAIETLDQLKSRAAALIRGLGWKDFELLIEILFARAGWHRNSPSGGVEKDTDLDLIAPISGRRAFVQVKSQTTRAQAMDYISKWQAHGHDEFYLVYHTATEDLEDLCDLAPGIRVLDLDGVAERVITTGLTQWLIDKRS